jgi:hypothetical protein
MYTASGGQDHTYKMTEDGTISKFTNWPGWTDSASPSDIQFDHSGIFGNGMFVATWAASSANDDFSGLFRLDSQGNETRFCSELVRAKHIAIDSVGIFGNDMFVNGDGAWNEQSYLWRVSPDGSASKFADLLGQESRDNSAITFGPDGALYVNEYSELTGKMSVIRVIPEPATLVLFGLGGLFFRHRSEQVLRK